MKRRLSSVATAVIALAPAAAWAQARSDGFWWHPMMSGAGWSFMLLGPFFMLLPLVVLVAVVFFIARAASGPGHARPPERTPLDILKERFARGEIDAAEFEDRRRLLSE